MAFNAGAVLKVQAVGDIATTSDYVNTFQFQLSGASGVAEQDAFDDLLQIMDDLYTIVMAVMNIATVIRGIYVATLDDNIVSGFMPFSSAIAGTKTNDMVPRGVAALTSFPTGFSRVILRKYWGTMDESNISTGGNLTGDIIPALGDAVDYLLTPQVIAGETWTYGHAAGPGAPFRIPLSGTVITIPAYQRRRRLGTGS